MNKMQLRKRMISTGFAGALALTGALVIASGGTAGAFSASPAGLSRAGGPSVIEFVQDKPKAETVTQKVKRIWRNWTAYKFDVACPTFEFALSRTSCAANGKNREDARAKCQSQNVFCQIKDSSR